MVFYVIEAYPFWDKNRYAAIEDVTICAQIVFPPIGEYPFWDRKRYATIG